MLVGDLARMPAAVFAAKSEPRPQPRRGAARIAATLSAEKQASISARSASSGAGPGSAANRARACVDRLAGDQSVAQRAECSRSPTAWVARPSITASARFIRSPVSAR